MRLRCWNITSWNSHDQEIISEMNRHRMDICALSETKRKGKGNEKVNNYIFIYSGKSKDKRAQEGVSFLIHEKYKSCIDEIQYISERILHTTLKFCTEKMHIISVYAPDGSKPKETREAFFNTVQEQINDIPTGDKIFMLGDFNARIGNEPLPGVMQKHNEGTLNDSGELLIQLCAQNEMRINNTFFPHKWQYKRTFGNSRDQESVIDYVVTNRKVLPSEVLDVRTLNSSDLGKDDHRLVLCKYRTNLILGKPKQLQKEQITKYNTESFANSSTQQLYQRRLKEKIASNGINDNDDVEKAWEKLRGNILGSATEAIGIRTINIHRKTNTKPWFTKEIGVLANEKRQAFLIYRQHRTQEQYEEYKAIRNRINAEITKLKRDYWERYSKDMEHDLYGGQRKVWNMLRNRKKPVNEYVQLNHIQSEEWVRHFQNLYQRNAPPPGGDTHVKRTDNEPPAFRIDEEEIKRTKKKLKNRKSPGMDNISNEMLKYGGEDLDLEIAALYQRILQSGAIPNEWRKSITIPIHKKGSRKEPTNYRGINLLCSVAKLLTKILSQRIIDTTGMSEEQQGFRSNRSTTDGIFIVRQLIEKSIEFDKPLFICFVDFAQAFDRVKLEQVAEILRKRKVNETVVRIIEELNTNNTVAIKINNKLTQEIPVAVGIRQGDSLSPTLFNMVMDEIIHKVKNTKLGYKLGQDMAQIVCFADDVVLMADSEDNLQRMLFQMNKTAKQYNMKIATEKTKSMVIAKEPIRCKLMVEEKIIEQVRKFRYLGVDITSNRNITEEVRTQVTRAAWISGQLRDVIWRNKYMNADSKTRIYKTCVRPIMTYGAETRSETTKTKQAMRTTEMKTLRMITGTSLRDRVRNTRIREECGIMEVGKWVRQRRRQWRDHVERMDNEKLAKIAMTGKPDNKRPQGRPPKRWRDSWASTSNEDH